MYFSYYQLLRLQDRVLNDVVLYLLGDEDPRVRHVAANTISRYLDISSLTHHLLTAHHRSRTLDLDQPFSTQVGAQVVL